MRSLKEAMENLRGVKVYPLEGDSLLLDLGGELLVTLHKTEELFENNIYSFSVGLLKDGVTRKGRRIIRIEKGKENLLYFYFGSGDVAWKEWNNFQLQLSHSEISEQGVSFAWRRSAGGGVWGELHIYPQIIGRDLTGRPIMEKLKKEIIEEL